MDVVVRPGSIEARTGRRVRPVRPDLTQAADGEIYAAGGSRVQLAVQIDAAGNVLDVTVLGSSGFVDVDLPCVRAMRQWWIEPSRDKSGHAVPGVIVVTLELQ